jgi:hypothetical protein
LDFENTLNIVYISLKTQRTFIPKNEGWNEDSRELGALIISWSISDEKTNLHEVIDDLFK